MSSKFTTVRLTVNGQHFEILVHPDAALNYKLGRNVEISQVLAVDEVFSDANKGLRIAGERLQKFFNTQASTEAAAAILRRGELQLTTEQRRRLTEEKKKQITNQISRNYVDPRTGLPHPPLRIEQAMQQVRVSVDPFRDATEQAKLIVEQLRTILPLRSERLKLLIKIPAQFAPSAIGVMKNFGELQREDWGADGTLTALLEIPAGSHAALIERLGSVTKGQAQAQLIK